MKIKQMVNWKSIATSILLLCATAAFTVVRAEWQEYQQLKDDAVKKDQMQQVLDVMQQIQVDMQQVKKYQLTVTGKATVRNLGTDCCMQINTLGKAATFADMKEARITNLSNPDTPSTVVQISGTFRNANPSNVATLSQPAGNLIAASPGSTIDIRIEPATP